MSITGSLVGYENNNEVTANNKKSSSASSRSMLNTSAGSMAKTCPSLNSSINNSVITTTSSNLSHHNAKYPNSKRKSAKYLQHQQQAPPYGKDHKNYLHLNSLWSIWYGVLLTLFQGYLAVHGAYRFLGCSLIQWKIEPVVELNLQIVLCGVVFILLPLFFTSAVFKVGNLANDGIKLAGLTEKRCSLSPHDGLVEEARGGTLRALWTHGGPTAAFIHIVIAMCLLLPRLLLEARIIENGLLPRENIWQTELDFVAINRRNLVVLSVISSPYQNISEEEVYNDTLFLANNNKLSESNEEQYRISYPKSAFFEVPDLLDANNSNENSEEDLNKMRSTMPMSASTTTSVTNKQSSIRTTPTTTTTTTTTTSTTLIIPTTAKGAVAITKPSTSIVGHTRASHRRNGNRQHRNRSHRKHSSKSEESRTSRSEETDRELELRHSKAIDFNRLEDLEMVTVFENPGLEKSLVSTSQKRPNSVEEELEYGGNRQSTTTTTTRQTTTTLRDSNIHIVKPEKLPEIIPATPLASNSKIFEIKTKSKKVKRMADDELQVEIEPEYLIGEPPLNESTDIVGIGVGVGIVDDDGDGGGTPPGLVRLDGFSGMLQTFFGIEKEIDVTVFSHPPSAEFMNLVVALLVWSVRYPAVFWSTTKPFATIFSVQMVASSLEIIFSFIGISNLYKLQIFSEAIPVHNPGLILNAVVTLSLFILATILVLSSSMIMYLYGHGRLAAKMRDRSLITMKTSETWIYFAHCASLCFVLALAVVKAPLLNDLSATYRNNLHCPTFISALMSVVHILLWIVIWLGLTAKRRWSFKLPPIEHYGITKGATQPLLISTRNSNASVGGMMEQKGAISTTSSTDGVEDIYWPKLTPSSPKLKVTFNEVTSTCDDGDEQDGKRHSPRGATLCIAGITGEIDDGDYATLRGASIVAGGSIKILHLSEYDELPPPPPLLMPPPPPPHHVEYLDDNTSEEGKLLACVRDDSVTYASTRDLEPPRPHSHPHPPPPPPLSNATSPSGIAPQAQPENMQLASSPEHLISPLAPVTVTLHTSEAHIASSSTPRCLRRADSGVPNEALTPRSDTTSTTESTTSPPERAPSESSSGVHSGEEREEVVIRPRAVCKPPPKPPQPPIAEEPYGRSTNMRMSSFNNDTNGNGSSNSLNSNSKSNSATLPLQRTMPEQKIDYSHCSTMPLPLGCHSQASLQYKPQGYSPQSVMSSIGVVAAKQHVSHTTLPNGVRYSNPHFLRRIPHITKAESPYGHLGLGAGHHTFSKLLQDPMQIHSLVNTSIPEDRDSANYSMSSDQDCLYATTTHHHHQHQHQHQHQHAN